MAVVAGGEHEPSENSAQPTKANTRGIGWATIAAIAFGVLFWLLGIRVVPCVGAIQAVWMIRLTSASLTALIIFSAAQPMRLPHGGVRWMALGMGAFDTLAFVLSNRGMQMEQVAVISVLGSLYGRELTRSQRAFCFAVAGSPAVATAWLRRPVQWSAFAGSWLWVGVAVGSAIRLRQALDGILMISM